ncbi:unnamed protein product [Echinostoma caproni]|uniref:Uncharacterized protein n=1 Tax=Echinostoma caproni TaxID=27848 RepID=A0A183ANX7_9TREM|nr:unnamed protein product [Echinostoma caproni]
MRYHTFNASALNNALDQMFIKANTTTPESGTAKARVASTEDVPIRLERRVSPPVTKPVDLSKSARCTSKAALFHRQSIDATQLVRQSLRPDALGDTCVHTDQTTMNSKPSDPNSEAWRYKEWPPTSTQTDTRKFLSTAEIDMAPVPPPRRMSACAVVSRQPPPYPFTAFQSGPVISTGATGSSDSRLSSGRDNPVPKSVGN